MRVATETAMTSAYRRVEGIEQIPERGTNLLSRCLAILSSNISAKPELELRFEVREFVGNVGTALKSRNSRIVAKRRLSFVSSLLLTMLRY